MTSIIASPAFSTQAIPEQASVYNQPLPKLKNNRPYNLFLFGELIDWRFSSPNLVYGRDGVNITLTGNEIVNPGKSYYANYSYNPGFRTGLGIKFGPEKAFDLVGVYTQLYAHPTGSVSSSEFSGLFIPLNWFSGPTATNTFNSGSLGLNLHFNWIEAQSGYTFLINSYLALRPYVALTSYLIDGKLNAHYSFTNALGVNELSQTTGKCNSWSIGPKVGLDLIGHINNHIGIFTNVTLTQQSSHVKMTTQEFITTPATGGVFTSQNGKVTENGNFSLIGLEIGPTWDDWFSDRKYHIQIRATYATSNMISGTNLSFLNNNNQDLLITSEFRGFNLRTTFEY